MSKHTHSDPLITGVYHAAGRGFGFVTPSGEEGAGGDYFIPPRMENGAWNGDTVTIRPEGGPSAPGEKREARVISVLKRANRAVTGAVRKHNRETWLVPDGDKLRDPILVVGRTAGLRPGDKAAVKISSYGTAKQPPMGTLAEVFGRDGSREAAVEAILFEQGIHRQFPPPVLEQAARAPQVVDPSALAGRLDLRDKLIITIDGAHARDLDDAVSLERDGQGRPVLGVHIADVSHYVPMGSPLDVEAWQRGTSVYFADQVVPMLPTELSNGICSLNPRVDRLTLSCIMTLAPDGSVAEYRIVKSVIRTAERMNYPDCNALLQGGSLGLEERYAHILPMLREMAGLSRVLERRRRLRGGLDLESRESEILCDDEGRPVSIRARAPGESEGIIESFMLAANECVARHLSQLQAPAVYRIHEKPSAEKAEALRAMLAPLGYDVREPDNFSLQKLLDQARGTPQEFLVHTTVLRSLMKARYEPQNLGHFGLAAPYYCHFTSPIRRYPDLMVHRCLTALLDGAMEGKTGQKLSSAVGKAARQSSERELSAQTAEREIEKRYLAEYMASRTGETFAAAVSGVTRFGLFVLVEGGAEGFLPAEALPAPPYTFDEAHMTLSHGEERYTLGTLLQVVCASADPGSGQIVFRLPGHAPRSPSPGTADRERSSERRVGRRPGRHPSHGPKHRKGRNKR
ncbi:MAG: ribonuclease R [Clostridiales bacterium]|nr:ribonuclease R [Clostridiales bacterium]MDY4181905.1 ribonuclease R [Pseudoflavonifractor sp.]